MPRSTDTRLCSGQSMLCKLRLSKIGNFVSWHDESLLIAQHRLLSVLICISLPAYTANNLIAARSITSV